MDPRAFWGLKGPMGSSEPQAPGERAFVVSGNRLSQPYCLAGPLWPPCVTQGLPWGPRAPLGVC